MDEAALRLRDQHALELIDALDTGGRWELLAEVVWPTGALRDLSRSRTIAAGERGASPPVLLQGCGIPHADG